MCSGNTSPGLCRILVRTSGDIPENHLRHALLHEVLHAIWWTHSIDVSSTDAHVREEEAIGRQAAPLLGVLRDNPLLVAYLTYQPEPEASCS